MAVTQPREQWRYEDLLALPDDGRRWEIIDGELFELTGPTPDHSDASANLMFLIGPTVRALGGRINFAPLDVFFAGADPVQPDIVVLLPDRLHFRKKRGIEGPPNLLVEILSPSNTRHDTDRKRALYARGGVPEYWLVDPEAASIEVLVLADDAYETRLLAAGDEAVTSSVLASLSFPASAAFA